MAPCDNALFYASWMINTKTFWKVKLIANSIAFAYLCAYYLAIQFGLQFIKVMMMRCKEYIKRDIENAKKSIEKTANEQLGFLLYSLQLLGHKDNINIGHFNFYANKHDTGVSVRVYIKNGDETYDVINGTYWYNQSQYGHNKFTKNRGAWDSHLDKAIVELRDMAISGYESRISRLEAELDALNGFEESKKQKFEAIFTCQ